MTLKDFCSQNGIPSNEVSKFDVFLSKQRKYKIKTTLTGSYVIDSSNSAQVLELLGDFREEQRKIHEKRNKEQRIRDEEQRKLQEKQMRLQEEEAFLKQEEERIAGVVRTMPITSTPSFEGYRIVEYGGYVSGDEAIELMDGMFGGRGDFNKDKVNDKIKQIRSIAIEEMKIAAAQIGCNAVVGLDFDYVTVDRQQNGLGGNVINRTFIILTANGTAVTIEPL